MPKKLNASLAFINIPSDNPKASSDFYSKVFGIDLARNLSKDEGYHAPISDDGIDVNVNPRHAPQESTTAFVAVDNLQSVVDQATQAGGRVLWGPEDVRMSDEDAAEYKKAAKEVDNTDVRGNSMGRAAIVADPGGSQIGFVQLAEHTHKHFAVGRFQRPLDDYRVKAQERAMKAAKQRRP